MNTPSFYDIVGSMLPFEAVPQNLAAIDFLYTGLKWTGEVLALALCATVIYRLFRAGKFPRPISLCMLVYVVTCGLFCWLLYVEAFHKCYAAFPAGVPNDVVLMRNAVSNRMVDIITVMIADGWLLAVGYAIVHLRASVRHRAECLRKHMPGNAQ